MCDYLEEITKETLKNANGLLIKMNNLFSHQMFLVEIMTQITIIVYTLILPAFQVSQKK